MSQYNKLSDIQYAWFHILPVDLYFETVLVSWYPHHAIAITIHNKPITVLSYSCQSEVGYVIQSYNNPDSMFISIVFLMA